jgi:toxin ParE1/3/4
MANVDRFRRAEEDLLAIAEHIAKDSPRAASRWVNQIERTLSLLASQPFMGEAVDEIRPGLRRFCEGNYLLFYEPRENGIGLVRVLHGARRIETLFD